MTCYVDRRHPNAYSGKSQGNSISFAFDGLEFGGSLLDFFSQSVVFKSMGKMPHYETQQSLIPRSGTKCTIHSGSHGGGNP